MPKVIIDDIEYIENPYVLTPPQNDLRATHWAELPDGSVIMYRVFDDVKLWLPLSEKWTCPGTVPYTLNCFADYEEA